MHRSVSDGVGLDQFVRLVSVDVVLETVVSLVILLGPTGVRVLLRQHILMSAISSRVLRCLRASTKAASIIFPNFTT